MTCVNLKPWIPCSCAAPPAPSVKRSWRVTGWSPTPTGAAGRRPKPSASSTSASRGRARSFCRRLPTAPLSSGMGCGWHCCSPARSGNFDPGVDHVGMTLFRRFQLGFPTPNTAVYGVTPVGSGKWAVKADEAAIRTIAQIGHGLESTLRTGRASSTSAGMPSATSRSSEAGSSQVQSSRLA